MKNKTSFAQVLNTITNVKITNTRLSDFYKTTSLTFFIRVHLNFGWIYKVETNKVPVYLHMCFKWQHPDPNTDELNK